MKRNVLILLLSFLVGAVIFSSLRYISAIQARAKLESELSQAQAQVGFLEGRLEQEIEAQKALNERKLVLEASLKEAEEKMGSFLSEQEQAQERIFGLVKEISDLKEMNEKIQKEKASLEDKLEQASEQNKQLVSRLRSISELKKVIKDLKLQIRKERVRQIIRKDFQVYGNRGFVTKDGTSTYKSKVQIEVNPAQ